MTYLLAFAWAVSGLAPTLLVIKDNASLPDEITLGELIEGCVLGAVGVAMALLLGPLALICVVSTTYGDRVVWRRR